MRAVHTVELHPHQASFGITTTSMRQIDELLLFLSITMSRLTRSTLFMCLALM
jgi:hypothetical protein